MNIAVIGNGAVGYCTAISLLKEGREVSIYTKAVSNKNPIEKVSLVACALWQPYKLYSDLENENLETKESTWKVSEVSLEALFELIDSFSNDKTGVYERMHYEYSVDSINEKSRLKSDFYYVQLLKEFWSKKGRENIILEEVRLKPNEKIHSKTKEGFFEYLHGYLTYIIDTPIFLSFLDAEFKRLGGTLIERKIDSNSILNLKEKVVFNCTGINGFQTIFKSGKNLIDERKIVAKQGVLLLYKLNKPKVFPNTIVLDELTILCRKNCLTIGTGEIRVNESKEDLIKRLIDLTDELLTNENYNDFEFKEFLELQSIDINEPSKVLVGSRPYFSDGKGYYLNSIDYPSQKKKKISLYNNFGHGGSGITLCWGTAIAIKDIYINKVQTSLTKFNSKRQFLKPMKYSIELCHFDYREIRKLSDYRLEAMVKKEFELLKQQLNSLGIERNEYSISVLIDNKEKQTDYSSERRFRKCLESYDIDYIAYEKSLVNYLDQLENHLPTRIKKDFDNRQIYHQTLGCAQDIFLWYSLRFGIVEYDLTDKVITPISENALNENISFFGNSLITLLPKRQRKFEENADEYIRKTFGFEVTSSIKRIYYERKNEI